MSRPGNGNSLYRSRVVIEVLNNDGTPLETPVNQLIDECVNLSADAAKKHHYALKIAYGKVLGSLADNDMQAFADAAEA